MKKTQTLSMALAILMSFGLLAGCASGSQDIHDPSDVATHTPDGEIVELVAEMVPLSASPAVSSVLTPTAPGTQTKSNQKAVIDYSNTGDGYVMVKFVASTNKQLRVIIKGPSDVQYTYTLKSNGSYEVFPLSDGSGNYSVGVFEQIEGSRYATANNASFKVTLKDEFAPFLRPNQYVNFNANSKTVAKAAELMKGQKNELDKVSAVYNFVISTFKYDKDLAANVKSGYLPDVDAVLAKQKGICFDYAAVMTAMLRSQGIPTRLVVGYAGQTYHAWIDVYSAEKGWVNSVISFDGKKWQLMDPTFASTGNQSSDVMRYIGDGKNYSAKYLY